MFLVTTIALNFPLAILASDDTYQHILKRKVSSKMIKVQQLIKKKNLQSYVTLSLVVNGKLIYCHYKKEGNKKFKLAMCY
jgi:hypothetical protein